MQFLKRLSIKWTLGLFLGAMGFIVLTYCANDLYTAFHRQTRASAIVTLSQASRVLLNTLLNTRLERGGFNAALSAENAADPATTDKILNYRKIVEAGYQDAVARIGNSDDPLLTKTAEALKQSHDAMVAAQGRLDASARQPKSARDPKDQPDSQIIYQSFLDGLTAATNAVDAKIRNADKVVDQYLLIKQYAWLTRVQYGGSQGRIQAAVAANRPWTTEESRAGFEDRGKTLSLWATVQAAVSDPLVASMIRDAFKKADEENFSGAAWDATKQMYDTLSSGKPAPITIKELQPADTARAGYIVTLANVALDQMVARSEEVTAQSFADLRNAALILAGCLMIVLGGMIVVSRRVSRPLLRMNGVMRRLALGELNVTVPSLGRSDEIGEMAQAVQVFKDNIARNHDLEVEARRIQIDAETKRTEMMLSLAREFEAAVSGVVEVVSTSALEMEATARTMTASARETLEKSTSVSAAAEEASTNVSSVAGASEELSASVGEIARQVEHSVQKARVAVSEAEATAEIVIELSEAASRINAIVDMISQIAGQTNLLALNATIEAARAGEAGRGFAVVASEVKELANQTSKATTEIGHQITSIQSTTSRAVGAISGITNTIREINAAADQIATTVQQQSMATQEILQNVTQASVGAGEVTENIVEVARAANTTGAGASQVLSVSTSLARQAGGLRDQVQKFLATIRAA